MTFSLPLPKNHHAVFSLPSTFLLIIRGGETGPSPLGHVSLLPGWAYRTAKAEGNSYLLPSTIGTDFRDHETCHREKSCHVLLLCAFPSFISFSFPTFFAFSSWHSALCLLIFCNLLCKAYAFLCRRYSLSISIHLSDEKVKDFVWATFVTLLQLLVIKTCTFEKHNLIWSKWQNF